MALILWQGSRPLITSGAKSEKELTVPDATDFQRLIAPLRKENINSTDTVEEYESLKRELRLPPGYEKLAGSAKSDALNRPDITMAERMRLLDLAARKNVLRAFA